MKYISTRGQAPELGFGEAMMTGLARDGGLYVPETIPQFSAEEIKSLSGLSYEEVAFRVMRPFIAGFFSVAPRVTTCSKKLPSNGADPAVASYMDEVS